MTAIFDVAGFPTLETERLVLRSCELSDADDMLVFRGDPEVQKYNAAPMRDLSEATALIEQSHQAYAARTAVHWAVTLRGSGHGIGLFGYSNWDQFHRRAEVGYDLTREYWGRGIATEAMLAIVEYGFTQMQLHRVEAYTIADNHRSVRLLQRLGFRQEGLRREASLEDDGTYHDSAIYGILASDRLPT